MLKGEYNNLMNVMKSKRHCKSFIEPTSIDLHSQLHLLRGSMDFFLPAKITTLIQPLSLLCYPHGVLGIIHRPHRSTTHFPLRLGRSAGSRHAGVEEAATGLIIENTSALHEVRRLQGIQQENKRGQNFMASQPTHPRSPKN